MGMLLAGGKLRMGEKWMLVLILQSEGRVFWCLREVVVFTLFEGDGLLSLPTQKIALL